MTEPKKPLTVGSLATITGRVRKTPSDFNKPISLIANWITGLQQKPQYKPTTDYGIPGALPTGEEGGGGGGGGGGYAPLRFAQTQAGEALAANLRYKLEAQRDSIDLALQQQAEVANAELLRKQFLQERELEQKALTQARSKLFVDTIGRDISASILFALTGKI